MDVVIAYHHREMSRTGSRVVLGRAEADGHKEALVIGGLPKY